MGVAADDDVHAPGGIQRGCEFLVFFKADMGQQHGQVDIRVPMRVTNLADLAQRILKIDQHADQTIVLCA